MCLSGFDDNYGWTAQIAPLMIFPSRYIRPEFVFFGLHKLLQLFNQEVT